ncbi:MAG: phosphoribosylanthranilate isomerase [Gallionella sp.]|nr:phosphoribosylanthranilate isomerase [Gallionella sp.]
MTRIKICGITRTEDALTVAASGADAAGFVFYAKSPRHVSVEQAARLVAALPPFVTTVGLFVDADVDFVRQVMGNVPLDVLQFHGDESPEYCAQFGRPYLKAIRVKAGVDLIQCAARYAGAQALLLDAHVEGIPGGTGATFDWTLIPPKLPLPVILSGGLDSANVAEGIRQIQPYAVDVSSGVESSKGIKDAAKVAAFINEVKRADVQLPR